MAGKSQVAVTKHAVIQRINLKLSHEGRRLRVDRRSGTYYILDIQHRRIVKQDVDLDQLVEDLGVLGEWEVMK